MQRKCYLLDTNMLGYLAELKSGAYSKEGNAVQKKLDEIRGENVFICCISIGELEYGLKIAPYKDIEKQNVARAIAKGFNNYSINEDVAREQYAELRAKLFEHCAPRGRRDRKNYKKRVEEWIDPTTSSELQVQENDVWIAAVAMTYNLVLVTHDKMKVLQTVTNNTLMIEDWTK